MASLRRLVSLDCVPSPVLSPSPSRGTRIVRHSSLPNPFLHQADLAIGDLIHESSSLSNNASLVKREGLGVAATTKVSFVCKATVHRSSNHRHVDDSPEFENSFKGNFQDRLSRPFGTMHRQTSATLSDSKKEEISASVGLDIEKSAVYAELKECSSRWQVPASFFSPYEVGEKFLAPASASHEPASTPYQHHVQTDLGLQTGSGLNGAKEPPMSLRMLKRKLSKANGSTIHRHLSTPDQHHVKTLSDLCLQKGSGKNDAKDPPISLRMLKQKLSKVKVQAYSDLQCEPLHNSTAPDLASHCDTAKARLNVMHVSDSVTAVFASLFYMLKLIQHYAFTSGLQPYASVGADAADDIWQQNCVHRAHAEMLDSFLWLFQQVFSCTPKLMLLTMILLADFTLHSVSKHVALPVMPSTEALMMTIIAYKTGRSAISTPTAAPSSPSERVKPPSMETDLSKPGIRPIKHIIESRIESGGNFEVEQHGQSFLDWNIRSPLKNSGSSHVEDNVGARNCTSPEWLPFAECLLLQHQIGDAEGIILDQRTKNMLVAPVLAPVLEADNYPCYDQTDLTYQREIDTDPSNPLLLANYAQFLHVVRHDNDRAEKLYRRAMLVDRDSDGEVMGKFASFMWVVKGDVVEAENAYKAAIAADPGNAYHSGSYAHFLWSSSVGQAEEICCGEDLGNVCQCCSSN